jgi:uncharacterized protein DUF6928
MGAKTWMLVYANGGVEETLMQSNAIDRNASLQLARDLFPEEKLEPMGDGSLLCTCPPDDEVHLGCFPGVSIVAAKEFGIDYPSKLSTRFISPARGRTIYLHAMHSAVDWLALAKWVDGQLVRSLSVAPDSGVLEDIGQKLPFEEPFWSGKHPATDDEDSYPLPFHPLELGEVALKEFFGYQLEGFGDPAPIDPESVPLLRFKRRHWWKMW